MALPRKGINLYHTAEWVPAGPYADAMAQCQQWSGSPTLDANGFPSAGWPFFTRIVNPLGASQFPTGTYFVFFDGTGTITIAGDATATITTSGQSFTVANATGAGVQVTIASSSASPNHVRNIHIPFPGHESDYASVIFHRDFLTLIGQCGDTIRFMDPMGTNASKQILYANRPTTTWYTKNSASSSVPTSSTRGMPIEHVVAMGNRLSKNIWICVPHRADDDYVTQLATYIAANLNAGLKVYVEYTNEHWNQVFDRAQGDVAPTDNGQYTYCANQGALLSLGSNAFQNRCRYYKRRAVEVFDLFTAAFGGNSRLVRVIGGQAGSNTVLTEVMNFESANNGKVDALAVAPYMGGKIGSSTQNPSGRKPTTLDHFFTDLALQTANDYPGLVAAVISAKTTWGKPMLGYEGGGAFEVATSGGWANDPALQQLFNDAMHDPRMYTAHETWFALLTDFELVNYYAHAYEPSTDSAAARWGLVERMNQPLSEAQRLRFWATTPGGGMTTPAGRGAARTGPRTQRLAYRPGWMR